MSDGATHNVGARDWRIIKLPQAKVRAFISPLWVGNRLAAFVACGERA